MILTDSLLYKIDQKLNKLSSNSHQSIELEDKLLAINEAQITLVKQKLNSNNVLSGGLDAFKKRYEDLQNLVETEHKLPLKETDKKLNAWSFAIKELKGKYMFYVNSYLVADKGSCEDRVIYVNRDLTKHSDVHLLLNNNNYKPSFEYQETFCTIANDEIAVYTDGTFKPKDLYLSYIRYPKYIDKEGYIKLDGSASINSDCELQDYLEDELVDLAVKNLAMYTDNPTAVEAAQVRIQTNE
jgi:hypothetical protein